MRRRRFLLAALATPLVAGCSVRGFSPVDAAAPDDDGQMSPGEFRWHLENESNVSASSVPVLDMRRRGEEFGVTYESELGSTERLEREIELFYTTYAAYVADRETDGQVTVSIQGPADEEAAQFVVQADWVREWRAGDLSEGALLTRIKDTIDQ